LALALNNDFGHSAPVVTKRAAFPPPPDPPAHSLREYLRLTGVSQRRLATKAGVNQSMISMLVHRTRAARWKLAQKLHTITGVPVEVLVEVRPPRHRKKPPGARRDDDTPSPTET
jgi:transcriptional regulator with XRE-family HTH domain